MENKSKIGWGISVVDIHTEKEVFHTGPYESQNEAMHKLFQITRHLLVQEKEKASIYRIIELW